MPALHLPWPPIQLWPVATIVTTTPALTPQTTPIHLVPVSTSDQSTCVSLMRSGSCCPLPVPGFFRINPSGLLGFQSHAGSVLEPINISQINQPTSKLDLEIVKEVVSYYEPFCAGQVPWVPVRTWSCGWLISWDDVSRLPTWPFSWAMGSLYLLGSSVIRGAASISGTDSL